MNPYERIDLLDKWKSFVLYLSAFITVTLNFNDRYHFLEGFGYSEPVSKVILALNAVLIVSYVTLEMISIVSFQKAEGSRMIRFIDNSFGVNLTGAALPQAGYFSQDNISPGLYKMCVNTFENALFSSRVAKDMERPRYYKAAIVIAILIFSATLGDSATVKYITDAILPLALIQDAIRFYFLSSRLESSFTSFAGFFAALSNNPSNFANRHGEALKLVILYEQTLAWSSIKLDSDIFRKLNSSLSQEWALLKHQYQIQ